MNITYNPPQNVAYIRVREKRAEVETCRISDALNIDPASDGTVYGIELLNANEPTGHMPPAEFGALYYQRQEAPVMVAALVSHPPEKPGRFSKWGSTDDER